MPNNHMRIFGEHAPGSALAAARAASRQPDMARPYPTLPEHAAGCNRRRRGAHARPALQMRPPARRPGAPAGAQCARRPRPPPPSARGWSSAARCRGRRPQPSPALPAPTVRSVNCSLPGDVELVQVCGSPGRCGHRWRLLASGRYTQRRSPWQLAGTAILQPCLCPWMHAHDLLEADAKTVAARAVLSPHAWI